MPNHSRHLLAAIVGGLLGHASAATATPPDHAAHLLATKARLHRLPGRTIFDRLASLFELGESVEAREIPAGTWTGRGATDKNPDHLQGQVLRVLAPTSEAGMLLEDIRLAIFFNSTNPAAFDEIDEGNRAFLDSRGYERWRTPRVRKAGLEFRQDLQGATLVWVTLRRVDDLYVARILHGDRRIVPPKSRVNETYACFFRKVEDPAPPRPTRPARSPEARVPRPNRADALPLRAARAPSPGDGR